MSRPRRSDENPVVSIFMVCLLVVVAAGGIWHSTREKSGGGRYADSGSDSRNGPLGGTGKRGNFVEAFKRLPNDATALQRAADEEFDNTSRLLGADELTQIQRIMARRDTSREAYSDSDFAVLRKHGFTKWIRAKAIGWAQDDPAFHQAAESVWSRSSRARDDGEMTELAIRWGEMNRSARQELLRIIQTAEGNTRELTPSEREAVNTFAGGDFARRP